MNGLISFILILSSSIASANESCSFDHHLESGNLTAQETPMGSNCNLFLAPIDAGKPSRSYLFKSDGMIQVGDTYNIPGKDNVSTGTSIFFVFPRHGNPSAEIINVRQSGSRDLSQEVEVKLPSGDGVLFSTGKGTTPGSRRVLPSISSGEGGIEILEDPAITPEKRGGVQIKPSVGSPSIVLSVGYVRGNKPAFLDPTIKATFQDSEDHVCQLPNSLLFKKEGAHDAEFAFKSDATLFNFLRSHCPKDFQVPATKPAGGAVVPSGASGSAIQP